MLGAMTVAVRRASVSMRARLPGCAVVPMTTRRRRGGSLEAAAAAAR
jgi:hypothetical protein